MVCVHVRSRSALRLRINQDWSIQGVGYCIRRKHCFISLLLLFRRWLLEQDVLVAIFAAAVGVGVCHGGGKGSSNLNRATIDGSIHSKKTVR